MIEEEGEMEESLQKITLVLSFKCHGSFEKKYY